MGVVPVALICPDERIWNMFIGAAGLEDTLPVTFHETADEVAPVFFNAQMMQVPDALYTAKVLVASTVVVPTESPPL